MKSSCLLLPQLCLGLALGLLACAPTEPPPDPDPPPPSNEPPLALIDRPLDDADGTDTFPMTFEGRVEDDVTPLEELQVLLIWKDYVMQSIRLKNKKNECNDTRKLILQRLLDLSVESK